MVSVVKCNRISSFTFYSTSIHFKHLFLMKTITRSSQNWSFRSYHRIFLSKKSFAQLSWNCRSLNLHFSWALQGLLVHVCLQTDIESSSLALDLAVDKSTSLDFSIITHLPLQYRQVVMEIFKLSTNQETLFLRSRMHFQSKLFCHAGGVARGMAISGGRSLDIWL